MLAIFVQNKELSPAGYYRLGQYFQDLKPDIVSTYAINAYYTSNMPKKFRMLFYGFLFGHLNRIMTLIYLLLIKNKDLVIIIQRRVFIKKCSCFDAFLLESVLKKSKKVIWDFDDNVIDANDICEREMRLLYKYTTNITVPNRFLIDKVRDNCTKAKFDLIPTTDRWYENIKIEDVVNARLQQYDKIINIIWIGTASNEKYLKSILPSINKAAMSIDKKICLLNISNFKIKERFSDFDIKNIMWTREKAMSALLEAHIGIMPLELNYYTPGKASFKAVQYFSTGLPTILSPVGYNKEVISNDVDGLFAQNKEEWTKNIITLCSNKEKWIDMSYKTRENWEKKFHSKIIKELYLKIIYEREE